MQVNTGLRSPRGILAHLNRTLVPRVPSLFLTVRPFFFLSHHFPFSGAGERGPAQPQGLWISLGSLLWCSLPSSAIGYPAPSIAAGPTGAILCRVSPPCSLAQVNAALRSPGALDYPAMPPEVYRLEEDYPKIWQQRTFRRHGAYGFISYRYAMDLSSLTRMQWTCHWYCAGTPTLVRLITRTKCNG